MEPFREHHPATRPGEAAAALLIVVACFQALLAAGAPWGEAAYGGATSGVLPESLRASSAVAAVIYLVLAGIAGTPVAPELVRSRFMYGTSALMAVGAITNIASPSFVERITWTPVTILLVIALWRAARLDTARATTSPAPALQRVPGR
ncbi:hypothetical protein [Arthrobacter sp. CAN_C5]|uniref:hypothetical protein n=1 Tax=Arthrobacter sp. CAN_C5 TaxID=2760706 RepID=UPI001AEB558B|nr:hypothetical protein [Arthrobacter sp. CAN_C5]MBP2217000.1 hypothetical protein [Arthrobacter sp. CAN_C5]